jgi:hypothetical protein
MGFVIQMAPGKAEARAVVLEYPVVPTTQPGAIWARIPRPRSAGHGLRLRSVLTMVAVLPEAPLLVPELATGASERANDPVAVWTPGA